MYVLYTRYMCIYAVWMMNVCIYVCKYILCMNVYVCVYVCLVGSCMYVDINVYICMYVCIYAFYHIYVRVHELLCCYDQI